MSIKHALEKAAYVTYKFMQLRISLEKMHRKTCSNTNTKGLVSTTVLCKHAASQRFYKKLQESPQEQE